MKSILSIVVLLTLLSFPIRANEGNKGFCQKAETTADLMACIGMHYEETTAHMEVLYNTLKNQNADNTDFQAALNKNQMDWIAYRDDICRLEGAVYKGGSLERVQEIDCLARVTQARTNHFETIMKAQDESTIPVFASPPRWTNVLIREYPDTYWALGQSVSMDVDCDGVDENIISGLNAMKGQLAIADSQPTGRPTIHLLNQKGEEGQSCWPVLPLALSTIENNENICQFQVSLEDEACGAFIFAYDAASNRYNFVEKDDAE